MITERDEINIRRTAEQKARAEGVAEGKAEGRKEGLFEVAKKLLSKGVSISDVVDLTGLTKAEIEALLG